MTRRTGRTAWAVALALLATTAGGAGTASASGADGNAMKVVDQALARISEHRSISLKAYVRWTAPNERETFTYSGRVSPSGSPLADMTTSVPGRPSRGGRTIVIGHDIYQRFSPSLYVTDPGRPWVHIVNTQEDEQEGIDAEAYTLLAQAGRAHRAARARLHHQSTTRYRLTADYAKLVRTGPKVARTAARDLIRQGLTRETDDVWIDDEGLVRRVRSVQLGKKVGSIATEDFRAYDVPMDDIKPPPADQITEAAASTAPAPDLRRLVP